MGVPDGVGVDSVLGTGGEVGTGVAAGLTQLAAIATRTRRQRNRYNILECLIILPIGLSNNISNYQLTYFMVILYCHFPFFNCSRLTFRKLSVLFTAGNKIVDCGVTF